MASTGNYWEDMRKQARQLENEIDLKLVSFSKIGTTYGSTARDYKTESLDTVPLLSGEHMFDTMGLEIEQLLSKLTDVNDKMADYAQTQGKVTSSAALLHTLQRHRDILQDYKHDFQKTKTNIQARRDRDDLLGSVRRDIDNYKNSSGLNRRTDLFLKENEHLRNSERLVDDQISIAMETKEHLFSQRGAFKAIQTKFNTISNRFPMINSLVQRINLRKRRDSIVLGAVIGGCIIFLIVYALH